MARGKGKKKVTARRFIKLEGMGELLELSIVTEVNTCLKMFHLEQLEDGTWRLIYNKKMIPDISKLEGLTIVRE